GAVPGKDVRDRCDAAPCRSTPQAGGRRRRLSGACALEAATALGARLAQSTFAPDALTTGLHFRRSSARKEANTSGVPPDAPPSAPRLDIALRTAGCERAAFISAFSLRISDPGVPFGATTPKMT